jgi:hypothetical protein
MIGSSHQITTIAIAEATYRAMEVIAVLMLWRDSSDMP